MNAAELIEELKKVPPDTIISVWADQGQSMMKASTSGIRVIHKDQLNEYIMGETDDDESEDVVNIFEIGAP